MKINFSIGFLFLSFLFISCGSNDVEKFIGIWKGEIDCAGSVDPVSMNITALAEDNQVLIQFVGEEIPNINGVVDGDNITLEKTTIPDGDSYSSELSGSGTINDNNQMILVLQIDLLYMGTIEESLTCNTTLTQ